MATPASASLSGLGQTLPPRQNLPLRNTGRSKLPRETLRMRATRPGCPAQLGGAGPRPQPAPPPGEPSGGWPQDSSQSLTWDPAKPCGPFGSQGSGLICFRFPHQLNPGTGRLLNILSSQVPAAGKGRNRHPSQGGLASRVLTSLQMPGRAHPDGQPPGWSSHPHTTASPCSASFQKGLPPTGALRAVPSPAGGTPPGSPDSQLAFQALAALTGSTSSWPAALGGLLREDLCHAAHRGLLRVGAAPGRRAGTTHCQRTTLPCRARAPGAGWPITWSLFTVLTLMQQPHLGSLQRSSGLERVPTGQHLGPKSPPFHAWCRSPANRMGLRCPNTRRHGLSIVWLCDHDFKDWKCLCLVQGRVCLTVLATGTCSYLRPRR